MLIEDTELLIENLNFVLGYLNALGMSINNIDVDLPIDIISECLVKLKENR